MGPLSKLWSLIDDVFNSNAETVEVTMEEVNEFVEQSITMLGQAFNNISYQRRIQSLSCLLNDHQGKQMLKEKHEFFSSSQKELFGDKFQNDWYQTLKTKQKCQEVLKKETSTSRGRTPFRGGPSSYSNRGRSSGGRTQRQFHVRRNNYQNNSHSNNAQGFRGRGRGGNRYNGRGGM